MCEGVFIWMSLCSLNVFIYSTVQKNIISPESVVSKEYSYLSYSRVVVLDHVAKWSLLKARVGGLNTVMGQNLD